jgi:peptidoglycan/xylan/chitin deacetylase (PgdA/CDA1 family)
MTLADVTVLCYHRISSKPLASGTWVGPAQLERQLDALSAAGARFISPDDYHQLLVGAADGLKRGAETPASKPAVLVTFDDATTDLHFYRDILNDRGLRPLVFAPSAILGEWNRWEWPIPGRRVRHLAAAQLRELVSFGWEVGLHGATHCDLTRLGSGELAAEVDRAHRELETAIDQPVRYFSYPYGRTNPAVTRRVQSAGFSAAFVLTDAPAAGQAVDQFQLSRRPVYCIDGAADVLAKVSDPEGRSRFGRWQRRKESGAHGVGRWTAGLLSRRG